MQLHAGQHNVVTWMGLAFDLDTIYATILVSAIVILITVLATRGRTIIPGPLQNGMELVLDSLFAQFKPALGKHAAELSSVLFTFFLFIFVSNEIGLLPNPHILASPTNNINTTLGLALASTAFVWIIALKIKGKAYLAHFFKPFKVFVIINVIEEIVKPMTLAFRLFGNILAGEILLEILYYLVPVGVPIIWLIFSLVIGLIQAFIFTILTTSYLGSAISDDH